MPYSTPRTLCARVKERAGVRDGDGGKFGERRVQSCRLKREKERGGGWGGEKERERERALSGTVHNGGFIDRLLDNALGESDAMKFQT